MSDVVNSQNSKHLKVEKYQFAKLDLPENSKHNAFNEDIFKILPDETKHQTPVETEELPEIEDQSTELLEKIDALTSEIVELQMTLEAKEKHFASIVEEEKEKSFDLGKQEGIQETSKASSDENDALKTQLIRSITLLDEESGKIQSNFTHIEEDLVESALLIAKKVIKKEINDNSAKVATSIAKALLETIKDKTTVTIKINPIDFNAVSEHFNAEFIKIVPDDAISAGGVVILSTDTNIDGTISTRLAKAIDLIGRE